MRGRVRSELNSMRRGSKARWGKERQLQQQKQKPCSIPALKCTGGTWARSSNEKANLLAKTFDDKCYLPDAEENEYYTSIEPVNESWKQHKIASMALSRSCLLYGRIAPLDPI